jgi:hypothetical protein
MAKCTATHLELLAHGLLVQALLMPGFVLKRSCGGFVEFVPLAMQGRKMLALLAGLAENRRRRGLQVYERAFMEHGVPSGCRRAAAGAGN